MQKTVNVVAIVLIAVSVLASGGRADIADARRSIQSAYDSMNMALSQKDADAYLSFKSEDYQGVNSNGEIPVDGKAAERARVLKVFAIASAVEQRNAIKSVTLVDGGVVVVVNYDYTRTQTDASRGLVGKLHEVGAYRDFWENTTGKWLLKRHRTLHGVSTITVNGRQVKSTNLR